jgi:hypothetical protein
MVGFLLVFFRDRPGSALTTRIHRRPLATASASQGLDRQVPIRTVWARSNLGPRHFTHVKDPFDAARWHGKTLPKHGLCGRRWYVDTG